MPFSCSGTIAWTIQEQFEWPVVLATLMRAMQPVEAGWPKLKLSPMTLRKDLSREQRELQWHLVQPCSISFGGSTELKPSPGIISCQLPI